ncbi:hypothetical protein A7Q09_10065 [Methylacidiphilum sp. Yel]|nr:hypothetical protein A7Q09_10065 [Methylacidiphilum sp. Yel]
MCQLPTVLPSESSRKGYKSNALVEGSKNTARNSRLLDKQGWNTSQRKHQNELVATAELDLRCTLTAKAAA